MVRPPTLDSSAKAKQAALKAKQQIAAAAAKKASAKQRTPATPGMVRHRTGDSVPKTPYGLKDGIMIKLARRGGVRTASLPTKALVRRWMIRFVEDVLVGAVGYLRAGKKSQLMRKVVLQAVCDNHRVAV